jgi:hypothetical protein
MSEETVLVFTSGGEVKRAMSFSTEEMARKNLSEIMFDAEPAFGRGAMWLFGQSLERLCEEYRSGKAGNKASLRLTEALGDSVEAVGLRDLAEEWNKGRREP